MTTYPAKIDNNTSLPIAIDNVTPIGATVFNQLRSAIIATEQELGVKPSGTYSTVRARLDALEFLASYGGFIGAPAGGDLSGTYPNPTVSAINLATVPTIGSLNQVLTVSGLTSLSYNFITNANVDAAAAIDGTKINPNFGSQNISTTGTITTGLTPSQYVLTNGSSVLITSPTLDINDLTIVGQTQGDVIYYDGTVWNRLAPGTSGQLLMTLGVGNNPQWTTFIGSSNEVIVNGLNTSALSDGLFGYVSAINTLSKTDASDINKSYVFGANEGVSGTMIIHGIINNAQFTTAGGSPGLGQPVYLAPITEEVGADGKLTATAPTTIGYVVTEVGIVLDNTNYVSLKTSSILLQPKKPVQL